MVGNVKKRSISVLDMSKKYTVTHKKSNVVVNGEPKLPAASALTFGEIAINYAVSAETLSIKNVNENVVKFSSDDIIMNRVFSGLAEYTPISAFTAHTADTAMHTPAVTGLDNGKVLMVVDSAWTATTPTVIYGGTSEPSPSLGNNGDVYLLTNPVVVYETDGTTGLLGHNGSSLDNNWQLENLDLSAYKEIRCYFACGSATGDSRTPAVVVIIPLDAAAEGPTGYIGSIQVPMPFNRNREYMVSCAVDTTKTKFQVLHQNTLWDISTSGANSAGRYCYKIEGYV